MKKIIEKIRHILLDPYYLYKYGGWYGLKQHLMESNKASPFLIQTYENYLARYGSWIGYRAKFDQIPCFPHGLHGIFISGDTEIGKNVVIFHQVTIGSNTLEKSNSGSPNIGDNVYIGAGAKIIGNLSVGHNARIGANAVVYKNILPHSVAVQAQTRVLQKENLNNRYYSRNTEYQWVYMENGKWVSN